MTSSAWFPFLREGGELELTLISISVIHNEGVIMPSLKYLPLLHIETELHSPKSFTQNFKCAIQVVCVAGVFF